MFQSIWSRLVGDTIQSRVIVTKYRVKCQHVNGINQIPKVVWLRVVGGVVSVNVTACFEFYYQM